jgi:hypothetical protein
MIARLKINLGKHAHTSKLIKKIINTGQMVLFYGDFVNMIVSTHPWCVIFLKDKDNRGSPWR